MGEIIVMEKDGYTSWEVVKTEMGFSIKQSNVYCSLKVKGIVQFLT